MRTHFAIALVAALGATAFAGPVFSADTPQQANMKSCAAQWSGMAARRQIQDDLQSLYVDLHESACQHGGGRTRGSDDGQTRGGTRRDEGGIRLGQMQGWQDRHLYPS